MTQITNSIHKKMGLKKGQYINRNSELRQFILEFLQKASDFKSITQIRDEIFSSKKDFLSNCCDLSSATNTVRMCILRLEKKQILKSQIFQSEFFKTREVKKFSIN